MKAFKLAKRDLGEVLSAFEFFDRQSLDLTLKHLPNARDPFTSITPFYVLIETQGSNKEHDDAKLFAYLESVMEDGIVVDGVLAQDSNQADMFWEIREGISEACTKEGGIFKYDLSVPVVKLYSVVEEIRDRLKQMGHYPGAIKEIVGFGHVGISFKFYLKVTEICT